jgi:hypothetical protein
MKHGWFYLGATLIVLGLVGVFIRKHHISTPKQFSDHQTTALNISPQVIKIGEQETSLAKQEIFQFDSWDAQNSLLHLRNQQGNSEQIALDPVKMQIMIPLKNTSRLTAMKVLHENEHDKSPRWQLKGKYPEGSISGDTQSNRTRTTASN